MLYLIPILTYDAYSVIFTFKMKSPMPQIWQENSPFKKSEEIWIMKRSAFRLLNEIRQDFIKEFFWPQRKQFEASLIKMPLTASSRTSKNGGLTGRDQTEEDQHMAVTPVNIMRDDYFTADLSSICTASHNLNLSYSP